MRSGISRYNWELLPQLADAGRISLFVDGPPEASKAPEAFAVSSAHDFLWRHAQQPFDLIVYQLGNAPCHDYMWAYLVRYPGLVVLHDGQLHHARGRMLLQQWRPNDYRHEFWFNHPETNPGVAELGAEGLLGSLTYFWPMLRIVVQASRGIAVHNQWLAGEIREAHPDADITVVEMGVPPGVPKPDARRRVRARHGVADEAVLFTAFGKITPEKRVREAIRAFAALQESVPHARLLLAGEAVDYYDMRDEAQRLGIGRHVLHAGYIEDDEIDDYLEASDVCVCMRWPTSRETSASWLRCLAAGKPTVCTDLVHTTDVPMLDPRGWSVLAHAANAHPVGVGIDILDEDHSLKLAMRRLATDATLRASLGANAKALWTARFQLHRMAGGYRHAIDRLAGQPPARPQSRSAFPPHLRETGSEHAESLARPILGREYHLRDGD